MTRPANGGPLPAPTHPPAPTFLRGLSLPHFPCPPPASDYANPRGRGTFAWPPPPTSCPMGEWGCVWQGWSHTLKRSRWDVVVTAAAPFPPPAPSHSDSGGPWWPDMPLHLSPSRLDGPHFSCLVSGGPGRAPDRGWGARVAHRDLSASSPVHATCSGSGPLSQSGEAFIPLTSCLFLLFLPHSADLFSPSFLLFALCSSF